MALSGAAIRGVLKVLIYTGRVMSSSARIERPDWAMESLGKMKDLPSYLALRVVSAQLLHRTATFTPTQNEAG